MLFFVQFKTKDIFLAWYLLFLRNIPFFDLGVQQGIFLLSSKRGYNMKKGYLKGYRLFRSREPIVEVSISIRVILLSFGVLLSVSISKLIECGYILIEMASSYCRMAWNREERDKFFMCWILRSATPFDNGLILHKKLFSGLQHK